MTCLASTLSGGSLAFFFQVAVVDEIQMMGDPYRGASFTRAILGLPAREVHVCGDPAALPLIRLLAAEAGDSLHGLSSQAEYLRQLHADSPCFPQATSTSVTVVIFMPAEQPASGSCRAEGLPVPARTVQQGLYHTCMHTGC